MSDKTQEQRHGLPEGEEKVTWENLVNAESGTGAWDFFNVEGQPLKLVKFDIETNEVLVELLLTREEWVDLIDLIRRISPEGSVIEKGKEEVSEEGFMKPLFDYHRCPLHRYTFSIATIRKWVEDNCEGRTLNLFAGRTKLNIHEVRNDLDEEALADYRMDALEFLRTWQGEKFNTILLDPPYAYRKSMEMYKGIKCSPFRQLKDEIKHVIAANGKVITFGYHSNTMGSQRGFLVEKIALFSHGGAIHDTIASVERLSQKDSKTDVL